MLFACSVFLLAFFCGLSSAQCIYGSTSFIAGGGSPGGTAVGVADGVGSAASFNYPSGLAFANGKLFIPDYPYSVIRLLTIATATATRLAGGGSATGTTAGYTNGIGTNALFNLLTSIAANPNGTFLWIADQANNVVRGVDVASRTVTSVAGGGGVMLT